MNIKEGLDECKFFEKTLTNVNEGIYIEKWKCSNDEFKLGSKWQIKKCRLYGGLSDGIDIIEINNGCLSFIVVPTRGMGIWKGWFKDICLGWDSPVKNPVNPNFINLEAYRGLGWLEGFNEWIVRCGLESIGEPGPDVIIDDKGNKKEVMLTLHGKIANIPASIVKAKVGLKPPYELGVTGVVYESSMCGSNLKMETENTTTLGSNSLKIVDEVKNLRSISDEMQILYHCNFGPPFLEYGSHFIAPIREVAPRDSRASEGIKEFDIFGPPESGFIEQVYFLKLIGDSNGNTLVMLTNKDEAKAVSISFSINELPYFTIWKNTNSLDEGYVVGLEPGTSYPNPKAFERAQNRVIKLNPKEKRKFELNISIHIGKDEVQKLKEKINKIRKDVKPKIFNKPVKEFSP
ncbi:MAG: aldose 1-epimerase family protein [Candidatus Bathyarchaeia archaeon]